MARLRGAAASASTSASRRSASRPPPGAGERRRADLDDDARRRAMRPALAGHGWLTAGARRAAASQPHVGAARPACGASPAMSVGSQSKTTASSPADDDRRRRARRPASMQRVLDAEPGQPVGEVADGLVVAEVGLPHPALGLLAAHAVAARPRRVTVKPASSTASGGSTIRGGSSRRGCRARGQRPARPSRTSARAAPRGWPRETSKTGRPRASRSGVTISASSRASGTSILLSATSARPVVEAAVRARARPR